MKPINRRNLALSLLAAPLTGSILGGCSTTHSSNTGPFAQLTQLLSGSADKSDEDRAREARLANLSITHPDREEDFNDLWANVVAHTKAIPMSDNRIQIRSSGTFFAGENISEQNFFIRAAAETLRNKKQGFVIKQIDFFNEGTPWASLGSNLNLSTRNWIGNIEDFRANRNEQNIFSSQRKVRNKGMEGVILLLDSEEFPNRDRFTAAEIYLNLLNYKSN